ncbi:hypothetical protein [Gaetbulibacter aestuarii]|uniref:Uncharacterized protein n=1 Tax=Gaetbulibacter aestuarii TaxID=1502358 RepID=A0ABW7MZL0_9FLAO
MSTFIKSESERNKLKLLLKLFSPIISVIILIATDANFYVYPVVFSLIVALTNLEHLKHKTIIGVLLCVAFSYIAFFVGILGANILDKIFVALGIQKEFRLFVGLNLDVVYTISTFVLSPMAVFFLFKYVFKFPKTKITFWTQFFAIIILIMNSMVPEWAFGLFNVFNFWQIIMILALQIIMNQSALIFPGTHKNNQVVL